MSDGLLEFAERYAAAIFDPVMRDQFAYTKGQTMLPRSTGGFQEMAGRITR